ncbi:MAG: hypothetical protein ABSH56_11865 [Bryobacteraceae bacterium]|jgi:hypothetical protein
MNGIDLDVLTRRHTAFASFVELARPEGEYFPSLYPDRAGERVALADAYDQAMMAAGSLKRAFRGTAGRCKVLES